MMLLLGLNETIHQLAMANSVHWHSHVLRRENGHALRSALDFEVEGQGKNWRPKRNWKEQVEDESVKVGLSRDDALCQSKLIVDAN